MTIRGHDTRQRQWAGGVSSAGVLLRYFPIGKAHPSCILLRLRPSRARTMRTNKGGPILQRTKRDLLYRLQTRWERRRRRMRATLGCASLVTTFLSCVLFIFFFVFVFLLGARSVGGNGKWRGSAEERGGRKKRNVRERWKWTARPPVAIGGRRNTKKASGTYTVRTARTFSFLLPRTPTILFHR